ncbi:NeuD/PglB/VioB family sugar acetyltransferase [Sphingomonas sp. 2SG]|uniref:NeuD/PglB/VioB family sugar acetyltransferase n=1 Tax=Sphingomonas sp. 2SG TaxID=2502201 RepID=UPI001BB18774|nr:NeuD/PglB/VioB family sugar acetyltransferase [Sphingomonas sp. 2SG]
MMEKGRTIIVGAGGFGRELISWANDAHVAGRVPPLAGLIDDDSAAMNGFAYSVGLLGSIADFVPQSRDQLLMAIGTPRIKDRVAALLGARGGRFTTLIHPTAVVAGSAILGYGVILCPLSLVSADVHVGELVSVNVLTSIGHDVSVGRYSTLSAHVDLTGGVRVEEAVMIGTGAKLLPRVKVGAGATIGAGSVVYRSVPAGRSVFAAPAKTLRQAQPPEIAAR